MPLRLSSHSIVVEHIMVEKVNERRTKPRLDVSLAAIWEGVPGSRMTRVTDLSVGGCYIDSIAEVNDCDFLEFKMQLPNGEWLELKGEVANHIRGMGFGIRFVALASEQIQKLQQLIEYLEIQAA